MTVDISANWSLNTLFLSKVTNFCFVEIDFSLNVRYNVRKQEEVSERRW